LGDRLGQNLVKKLRDRSTILSAGFDRSCSVLT
jgi:hypothetical protein